MKLYEKTNPVGIDIWINELQDRSERELLTIFGISSSSALFYPRCYKDGDNLLAHISNTKDYKPIGTDDRYSFISCIVFGDILEFIGTNRVYDLEYHCFANLSQLFTTITYSADEELREIIINFISSMVEPQNLRSLEVDTDKNPENMQPYYKFVLKFKLVY